MDHERSGGVVILTETNWHRWRFEMLALLESKDCLEVVDGTHELPSLAVDRCNASEIKSWKKLDALAKVCISRALDDQHHTYVRGCSTSKAMWDAIKAVREQQSDTHVLLATQAWHAFLWQPHHGVSSFLAEMNLLTQNVKSLGGSLDDKTVIGKILQCLPSRFHSFRMSWRLMSTGKETLSSLQSKLLAAELDMKTEDDVEEENGVAFFVNKKKKFYSKNSKKTSANNSRENKSDKKDIECWFCHKKGHKKSECKSRQRQDKDKSNAGFVAGHFSLSSQSMFEDGWFADSGAYAHMTGHKEWFEDDLHPIKPEDIFIGDGSCVQATHEGTIHVEVFNGEEWYPTTLNGVKYVPGFGSANLFSVGVVTGNGMEVIHSGHEVVVKKEKGNTILVGKKLGTVYKFAIRVKNAIKLAVTANNKDEQEVSSLTEEQEGVPNEVSQQQSLLWHQRLGHVGQDKMKFLIKNKLVSGLDLKSVSDFFCEGCSLGKFVKKPFGTPTSRENRTGFSIHADVCGPFSEKSLNGSKYFIVFKCEASAYRSVHFMKEKSQSLKCFKSFLNEMEAKTEWKVKKLRTDNGKEFINKDFEAFTLKSGIHHEVSPPYNPQMNGLVERENRTLKEMARSLLKSKSLPNNLWAEAVSTSACILNRMPNRKETTTTPYETWFGRKPSVKHFKIFGSTAFTHVPSQLRKGFKPTGKRVVFVGYDSSDKMYRVYDPHKRSVEVVRDVKFHESLPLKTVFIDGQWKQEGDPIVIQEEDEDSDSEIDSQEDNANETDEDDLESFVTPTPTPTASPAVVKIYNASVIPKQSVTVVSQKDVPKSTHVVSKPMVTQVISKPVVSNSTAVSQVRSQVLSDPFVDLIDFRRQEPTATQVPRKPGRPPGSKNKPKPPPQPPVVTTRTMTKTSKSALVALSDPLSIEDAMSRDDSRLWKDAMKEEVNSLIKNNTWELVSLPHGRKTITNKCVFRTKVKSDGSLDRYKARLVARGFSQRSGIDYSDTFAPVVRYESVRTVLALAAVKDFEIKQFDVKTAFLYGDLEEEIFMDQPEGFDDGSSQVCLLKKVLYGLKQAPRSWNRKFHAFLSSFGLTRSQADQCIYHSINREGEIILALYVDDGLACSSSVSLINRMLHEMKKQFEITVESPDCFVGLQLTRDRDKKTIMVSQSGYIERVLLKFNMESCKPAVTPGEPNIKLTKDMSPSTQEEKNEMSRIPYREAIGSLMFAMTCSRPDIAFEVSRVASFSENPGQEHWKRVKRVLRYLRGTSSYQLVFGCQSSHMKPRSSLETLTGYCDSDWGGDHDSRKSTSGYCFTLAGGPVSWSSRQQQTIALSSTEAEYLAAGDAVKEAKWLRQLMSDLGCCQDKPTIVHSDNQGAILLAKNPGHHKRTKHIDVRHHFIRQEVESGTIALNYIPTTEQPSDMLTKSLVGPKLASCRHAINVLDPDQE